MVRARTFLGIDADLVHFSRGAMNAAASAAPWQGFRLATINGKTIATAAGANAYATAPRLVAAGGPNLHATVNLAAATSDAAAVAVGTVEDGSLAWVGNLACWMSAFLTVAMIALAIG